MSLCKLRRTYNNCKHSELKSRSGLRQMHGGIFQARCLFDWSHLNAVDQTRIFLFPMSSPP